MESLAEKPKKGARILIVEDDPKISRLLELELKHEGFLIHRSSMGEVAVEDFYSFQPDLIILDIMLPDIDGWEVAKGYVSFRNGSHSYANCQRSS